MSILWGATAMNYYLLAYYIKYIPGDVYVNTGVKTVSEIISFFVSGYLCNHVGQQQIFIFSFLVAALGGMLIVMVPTNGILIAVFVFVAKFGISFAYNLVYIITPTLFPTENAATAFGICETSAMLSCILSPIVAELNEPLPMIIYSITSIGAMLVSLFLPNKTK